jgi:hypothetical protein
MKTIELGMPHRICRRTAISHGMSSAVLAAAMPSVALSSSPVLSTDTEHHEELWQ